MVLVDSVFPLLVAALSPNPTLAPQDVLQIQLEALKNDPLSPNHEGIRVAFNFASPENQAQTGPVERFIPMVRAPMYAPLLGFESFETKATEVDGDRARFAVVVRDFDGKPAGFVWMLSRQANGRYEGCWMTDAVIRVDLEPTPPSTLET